MHGRMQSPRVSWQHFLVRPDRGAVCRSPRATPFRYVLLEVLRREWPALKSSTGHTECLRLRERAGFSKGGVTREAFNVIIVLVRVSQCRGRP